MGEVPKDQLLNVVADVGGNLLGINQAKNICKIAYDFSDISGKGENFGIGAIVKKTIVDGLKKGRRFKKVASSKIARRLRKSKKRVQYQ